ncbi:hypothetical protein JTE90_003747 [Oedothorax gibbosus]|uniref:Uncharacterized protein n=1 Tax=Oedothorax gibbosus TaxID=931172 RepID=A0AAV6VBV8_9ARAC|nr:hypothetical protein JTE90_003747 [Oedothorax gibbosus]
MRRQLYLEVCKDKERQFTSPDVHYFAVTTERRPQSHCKTVLSCIVREERKKSTVQRSDEVSQMKELIWVVQGRKKRLIHIANVHYSAVTTEGDLSHIATQFFSCIVPEERKKSTVQRSDEVSQ